MLRKVILGVCGNFIIFFLMYLVLNYKKLDIIFVKDILYGWKILVILFFSILVMIIDVFLTRNSS